LKRSQVHDIYVSMLVCIEFVLCAGANRRRAGIVSDIARDDDSELCEKVDDGWLEEARADN